MRLNYYEDLEIDVNNLDQEFIKQPIITMRYGDLYADMQKERDEAHEDVKIIRSELIVECKENQSKATGPIIEAYYRTHEKHKKAKENLINTEHRLLRAKNAYEQFQFTRSKSIEKLADLHMKGLLSDVKQPKKDVKKDRHTNATNRQRRRLNKKKEN